MHVRIERKKLGAGLPTRREQLGLEPALLAYRSPALCSRAVVAAAAKRRAGADAGTGGPGADPNGTFLRGFDRQKLLREAAGLTPAQLGERVGHGEAHIAAVEQGRRIPIPELIDAVDRVVGAWGALVAMQGEAARVQCPSFLRRYVQLEAEAVELHASIDHVVEELLWAKHRARAMPVTASRRRIPVRP
ncbi:multiprotein-bridging factor 1 family protein [Streptomyces sp. NPDC051041]|uniref:multiprotein-bridging factor 1 family protein n=1 Tax=Streptomyces sp. NPDC051041 TaxID=3365640 RepID=UPI0037A45BA7